MQLSTSDQFVRYYNSTDVAANPQAGDILLKGNSVERTLVLLVGYMLTITLTFLRRSILDLVTNGSALLESTGLVL